MDYGNPHTSILKAVPKKWFHFKDVFEAESKRLSVDPDEGNETKKRVRIISRSGPKKTKKLKLPFTEVDTDGRKADLRRGREC